MPAQIEFLKDDGRRHRALLQRPDEVSVAFDGGAYIRVGGPAVELPLDIAHLIVEEELGLRAGVWGLLTAGGMFRHATVVAGQRAPHATTRGREVIARAGDAPMQAEMLTRAVCDLSAADADPDPAAVRGPSGSGGGPTA